MMGLRGTPPLPTPDASALEQVARVDAEIRRRILAADAWLRFDHYMDLVLHAPGLGYYASGHAKFGRGGDFITAPGLTPLFGQTLAQPLAAWMQQSAPMLLELGAGTGDLAAQVLAELERMAQLPQRYAILEPSAELQSRQRARLAAVVPHLLDRVTWLTEIPAVIEGVVFANEVLDALPVRCWRWDGVDQAVQEYGVQVDDAGALTLTTRPADAKLDAWVQACQASSAAVHGVPWPSGYRGERAEAAEALVATLAERLQRGVMLWIDYGFTDAEFYHPQRHMGTLVAHYRHRVHDDLLWMPGLNDLTAHVPFSGMASAAQDAGAAVLGFASQGRFLLQAGLLDRLARTDPSQVEQFAPQAAAVQQLIAESEMGELFKVLALYRGFTAEQTPATIGFERWRR